MQHHCKILRFQEGTLSQHPTPEATVDDAPLGEHPDAGEKLLVLVDLVPAFSHRSRELRTIVTGTYWGSSGSIVARLRRAMAAANRHLVATNANAAAGNKTSGSLTCAVCTGEELFLGQVGAAYAYLLHPDGQFELFPRRDRLLIPLAGSVPPIIHIGYTTLEVGATLLLATTPLAEIQARELWNETLSQPTMDAVQEQITKVIADNAATGSMVLGRMAEDVDVGADVGAPKSRRRLWPSLKPRLREVTPPPAMLPQPVPVREQDSPISPEVLVPEPEAPAPERVSTTPHSVPPSDTQRLVPIPPEVWAEPVGELPVAEAEDAVLPRETAAPSPAREPIRLHLPQISLPSVSEWVNRLREERRAAASQPKPKKERAPKKKGADRERLRQALRTLLPGEVKGVSQRKTRILPEEKVTVMGGLSLGFLLIVIFITLTMYFQFGGAARAEELLVDAQVALDVAFETQDPEDWYRLLSLSDQIITLDPQNAEAQELHSKAQQAIDALENAAVLDAYPLHDFGTAPTPRRLVVAGGWIYVLNTSTDEVIGLPLAEDGLSTTSDVPTSILKRGQTFYGEPVNRLVDLAWVEPGGNFPDGAIFIYSEGGNVYFYEPALGPGSITRQRVMGDLAPNAITLMETFGERFYLIHRQQNQIFTYEAVNGIYEDQNPRPYFSPGIAPQLQTALDIAIDGRVYLLMGDGTVRAYFTGTEDPSFDIRGLPDPDLTPIALAIEYDPEAGAIYLGDAQQERIVVLDKRGSFKHQFRMPSEELRQLETLAVSESPRVLYLIAENRLYAAPLPELISQ